MLAATSRPLPAYGPPDVDTPLGSSTAQRIAVLDVLRGIALLGMFVVHFTDNMSAGETGAGPAIGHFVELFLAERFWAMFAILFGVGFAIQLGRAEARGDRFVPRYLRRIVGILIIGLVAEIGFGYHVLVEYALWGLPLLLVRRWPVRRLVVLLVLCAASWSLFRVARTAAGVSTYGNEGYRSRLKQQAVADSTFNAEISAARESSSYATVVRARLRRMPWFYSRPYMYLPVNDFALFLIGMIAYRLRLFDRPREHVRLIATLALAGVALWAAANWLLPMFAVPRPPEGAPLVPNVIRAQVRSGLGLVRSMWLTFAYIGVVLLLVARNPAWLRRLAPFGWNGRMALTNYMVQVIVLDTIFSHYALSLAITPLAAVGAAFVLFVAQVMASRWWLKRYRYGPLEWLLSSFTYWRRQPLATPAVS